MLEKDLIGLDLQAGDRINIWVRFRDEPHIGEFELYRAQILFWKVDHVSMGKSLSELVRVERIEK
jgi:hypothetical protein